MTSTTNNTAGATAHKVSDLGGEISFDALYGDSAFPTITYAIADTVKKSSHMNTKRLDELAAFINRVEPVPQERIDALKATGLEGDALNNAIKVEGTIIHPGIFPEGARKRTKDNIEASTGAAFDFDYRGGDRTSRATVTAAAEAKGVAVILWDTFSSGIEAGDEGMTFRAVFPFAESQPTDTHAGRCKAIAEHLGFTAPGKPLPVVQGFFVAPRLGRTPDAVAVPGRCIDESVDFSNLPVDEDARQTAQETRHDANDPLDVLSDKQVADARLVIAQMRDAGLHLTNGQGIWHQVIGALAPYGEVGANLCHEFSVGDPKYTAKEVDAKIRDKLRSGATGIGRLFEIAAENGIENPATHKRTSAEDDFAAEQGRAEEEWATPVGLEAIEYTLDGFLSAGVTYIAGGHGIGKSSLLVPLASIVSGELPAFEQSISAMLQRKVVYITEDPSQARRIRYGLKKHNGLVENGHFRIVGAKRRSADEVELMMEATVKAHTITGPNGYLVKPLIVFDTTNACFEIENENDAAEVGRVMSALKQSGSPVWIIGHLAKAIARDDITAMTGRGSGAWEADAQGTAFIFADDEATDVRYLATKKRRFEPSYIEVKYITRIDHEVVVAPWCEEQRIGFRYGVPERACPGQRREEAANRQLEADVAEVFRYLAVSGVPMSKRDVEANSGVPRNRARAALVEGVRRGTFGQDGEYAIDDNRKRHDGYYIRVAEFG